MAYDVAAVRARYPALADGYAYLDGAAGTQTPVAVIDAISAAYRSAIGNVAGLDPAATGTRRERLLASMAAAEAHEQDLFAVLLAGLAGLPGITRYGYPARRTATVYFRVAGYPPRQVAEHLANQQVNVWDG